MVTINQYALHFDEDRYPDSDSFDPRRYLNTQASSVEADSHVRDHFSFGAGRRICPGSHLAENSLFITVAMILWAFEVRPPLRSDGTEEAVDISDDAYEPGVNTIPKPYRMRFLPLTPERAEKIRDEWREVSRAA